MAVRRLVFQVRPVGRAKTHGRIPFLVMRKYSDG